jgi:sugar/nucleoside kinase (ribokinase family)
MNHTPSQLRLLAAGYTTLDSVCHDGHIAHRAGGTAANVAAILAWLGWQTQLAAVIGADPAAARLTSELGRLGVGLEHLTKDPAARTPQVVHEIEDGRHRFLFRCPHCGRRFPRSRPLSKIRADATLERLERIDVFLFDRANPGTIRLAEGLREGGSVVVFEPSLSGSAATMEHAAALSDIIKFSDDRLSVLWSELPAPRTDQIQVVTRGEHGAVLRRGPTTWAESAALPVHALDPGGAGDWTTAGLLHKLGARTDLGESQLVEALRFGQALAALNCEWAGARGLAEHVGPAHALTAAEHLLQAKRRRPAPPTQPRRSRRGRDGCSTCLELREASPTSGRTESHEADLMPSPNR